MNGEYWQALDDLLSADLNRMMDRLSGGMPGSGVSPLPLKLVASALRLAERLSRRATTPEEKRRCVLICSLLWEHRQEEWGGLSAALIEILARLDLGPVIRMLDPEANGRMESLGSLFAELAVTARSIPNEVTLPEGQVVLLSGFQKKMWDAMETCPRIGVSAPTSAGKSFVIVHKLVEGLAQSPGEVLVVVPTISLIQQMTRDLVRAFRAGGLEDAVVTQTYSPKYADAHERTVYVLTQERAASALQHPQAFSELKYFIVDEIQNVERVAGQDDERSRILVDVIDEIVGNRNPLQVTVSGPRIEGIEQLAESVLGDEAVGITAAVPPVVNITYGLRDAGEGGVEVRQYAETLKEPQTRVWPNPPSFIKTTFGRQQYRDEEHELVAWVTNSIADAGGVLIFSPTANQAGKSAETLAERWSIGECAEGRELAAYAADAVHPLYSLVDTAPKGVGFHHGKMPRHLRVSTEEAFRLRFLRVLFCTTTLMQGVNLPAKTIIARNPKLFVRRSSRYGSPVLSGYEFANLRGRAGRLLQDFVGRTIILDETEFEGEELDLFDYPSREISYGYGARFQRHRRDIAEALLAGTRPREEAAYNDLVTYIRHAGIRHGSNAGDILRVKSITLADYEIDQVLRNVEQLDAPPEFIHAFRYWDPLELEQIYLAHKHDRFPQLPETPFVDGFQSSLQEALAELSKASPYYASKHLRGLSGRRLSSVLIMARQWASEEPLRRIIDWGYRHPIKDSKEVNRRIEGIQKHVVYDIPKTLSPVMWLQNRDNPLLTFLEMGGYSSIVRRLVELGLPRETAVRIREISGGVGDELSDDGIAGFVTKARAELNRWERLQVDESLVNTGES